MHPKTACIKEHVTPKQCDLSCGRYKVQTPSRSNLSHVANNSPPLQPQNLGLGAKPRRWALYSWHPKGIKRVYTEELIFDTLILGRNVPASFFLRLEPVKEKQTRDIITKPPWYRHNGWKSSLEEMKITSICAGILNLKLPI